MSESIKLYLLHSFPFFFYLFAFYHCFCSISFWCSFAVASFLLTVFAFLSQCISNVSALSRGRADYSFSLKRRRYFLVCFDFQTRDEFKCTQQKAFSRHEICGSSYSKRQLGAQPFEWFIRVFCRWNEEMEKHHKHTHNSRNIVIILRLERWVLMKCAFILLKWKQLPKTDVFGFVI